MRTKVVALMGLGLLMGALMATIAGVGLVSNQGMSFLAMATADQQYGGGTYGGGVYGGGFVSDTTAPTLAVVTPVSTPSSDTTPSFTFSSDEAGSIFYGGTCSSTDTVAVAGNNTVTFNALAAGTYSDCTVRVRDAASNTSTPLSVASFTITSSSSGATFVVGDHVRTQEVADVFASLANLVTPIRQAPVGVAGYVAEDEVDQGGSTWVRVNFKHGKDGYVAIDDLIAATPPVLPPHTTERDTVPRGTATTTLSHRGETDLNNDGIDDREEERVTTLINKVVTDRQRYNTLSLAGDTTRVITFRNQTETEVANDDSYEYPLGLYEFSAEVESGSTETVILYFDDVYDTNGWRIRKYTGSTFTDITGQVIFGTALVDGTTVTTATYNIVDNGPLDTDSRLGYITDPIGPAVEEDTSGGSSGGGGGGGGSRDEIETGAATTISEDSAVLTGTILEGDAWEAGFVLSATDSTPRCRDVGSAYLQVTATGEYDEGEAFSAAATDLTPNTIYYYLACGNEDEESGDVASFMTTAAGAEPVVVSDDDASFTPTSVQNSPAVVSTNIPPTFTFTSNLSFIQPSVNDPLSVQYLAQFLNDFEGENLPIDTIHSAEDDAAVKRFQTKYRREILDVWNLTDATGYVGITTRLKLNFLLQGQTQSCPVFTEYHGGISPITISPEIQQTKQILADLDMYSGPIDQVWTPQTHEAMIIFQETFREVMLDPWNITEGTGYKYKTTNKFLNYFVGCDTGAVNLEGVGVYEGI